MSLSRILLLVLIPFLVACQTPGPDSPFATVPKGSMMILNQDIRIPASSTKTYIQNGEVKGLARQIDPYCKVVVRDLVDVSQVVPRGTYAVESVNHESGYFVNGIPLMYAAMFRTPGDQPSHVTYGVVMRLAAIGSPDDGFRMICAQLGSPSDFARYPSYGQILETLGGVVTIIPPQ